MLPFILTVLAGFSTMLGSMFVFIKINYKKAIYKIMAFSAGIMLTISFFDLIPISIEYFIKANIKNNYIYLYLLMITIMSIIIINIINNLINKKRGVEPYYTVGILVFIITILHNIPEGIITYITSNVNVNLGIEIALAIAFHNIPEGLSISMPIYYSTKSKRKALFYTLIASLSEPLGAVIASLFLKQNLSSYITGFLFAFIAGLMIYISIFKLLKQALLDKRKLDIIICFTIGIILMYTIIIILN